MSFFKNLFSKQQQQIIPILIDLKQIYEIIMPTFNPQQYDFKVTFFKTHIKFKSPAKYDELTMRKLTQLTSVQLLKKTARDCYWRASYTEFLAVYSSPAVLFAQGELKKTIQQIEEIGEDYESFDSLVKYEETVRSIKDVLMQGIERDLAVRKDILDESIALLQQVIYTFETELHQKASTDKHALLEKLKFEQEFMKKQ